MAYLSKEAYENKREWAAKRMSKNAEIKTLTTLQHETMAWLCQIRHELHTHQDGIFNTGSADFNRFTNLIESSWGEGEINERLREAGLAPIKWGDLQADDIPDDYHFEEEGYQTWEDAYEAAIEKAEKINSVIEDYLRKTDEKHGTAYCPTGISRIVPIKPARTL